MATETILPGGAGDKTECSNVGGPTNWQSCTDDDLVNYVQSLTDSAGQTDLYTIAAPVNVKLGDTINSITVYIKARSTNSTYLATAYTAIKTNGTEYVGAGDDPPNTAAYTQYNTGYVNNPKTGVAWTFAELTALQIGVKMYSGDHDPLFYRGRCTIVWIVVDYTAGGGGGGDTRGKRRWRTRVGL